MDDIIESKDNLTMARKLSQDIEKAIVKGGFQVIKLFWITSAASGYSLRAISAVFLSAIVAIVPDGLSPNETRCNM